MSDTTKNEEPLNFRKTYTQVGKEPFTILVWITLVFNNSTPWTWQLIALWASFRIQLYVISSPFRWELILAKLTPSNLCLARWCIWRIWCFVAIFTIYNNWKRSLSTSRIERKGICVLAEYSPNVCLRDVEELAGGSNPWSQDLRSFAGPAQDGSFDVFMSHFMLCYNLQVWPFLMDGRQTYYNSIFAVDSSKYEPSSRSEA